MSSLSRELLELISSWAELLGAVFGILAATSVVVYVLATKPLRKIEAHDNLVLQEATARAQKEAAEASLELAKFKAPRTLDLEQKGRITTKAKAFAGMEFDVATSNSKEQLDLVGKIEEALVAAGWKELDWPSGISINRPGNPIKLGMAAETGVTVQVEIPQKAKLLEVAKELTAALVAEGISAEAQFMPIPQANHNAIHIVVGDKPR